LDGITLGDNLRNDVILDARLILMAIRMAFSPVAFFRVQPRCGTIALTSSPLNIESGWGGNLDKTGFLGKNLDEKPSRELGQ
jgi:hypothetical protein